MSGAVVMTRSKPMPTMARGAGPGPLRAGIAALVLAASCAAAWAQQAGNLFNVDQVSPAEWAMLPEYCPHTLTYHRDAATHRAWIARLGFGFTSMHHYCWGLLKASRAQRPGIEKQLRSGLFMSAVDECNYVLQNTPPDFLLRPEVLLRAGQWAAAAESYVRAFEYFEESIKSKADYWPPYLEIANVNLILRRRQHAIDALGRGLSVMPQQEQLTAALKRIMDDKPRGTASRSGASRP